MTRLARMGSIHVRAGRHLQPAAAAARRPGQANACLAWRRWGWRRLRFSGRGSSHPASFHGGVLLELAHFLESLEHLFHDSASLVDVGELATPEQDVHQHLVLVLEKLTGTLDLDFDV